MHPKECGAAIAAEYIGIPAVAIAAPTFVEQVYYTATNNGIAAPRVAEYPGAFALHTTEELIANTRNILWHRIVKALTDPITEQELNRHSVDTSRVVTDDIFYGTTEQLEADLIKTARRPTSERVFANYYANPGSNPEQRRTINQWQWHITNSETSQLTQPPVWHATSDSKIATIPTMKRGMTAILITGDESRNKVQIMPGGGFVSRAVR